MLIKTKLNHKIIDYLNQNEIVNLNILGVLENLENYEIYISDNDELDGVLVREGYFNYLYTESDDFLELVLKELFVEGEYGFSGLTRELTEKIINRFEVTWHNPCFTYYIPKDKIDITNIKNKVESIRIEDVKTVDEYYTYRGEGSYQTILNDITKRPSSAVYVNDEIVCWVLVHDDNSMGILFTKPEYRRFGYALDVTLDLANKLIKNGKTPFCHIVESNQMSPGVAKKCGFVYSHKCDWFGIDVK